MIDLKQNTLFTWDELKGRIAGKDKYDRVRIVVEYMNEFFAYLTGCSTMSPIVQKIYDSSNEKADVIFTSVREFSEKMQNKVIKVGKKTYSIGFIWLKHEKRQEYYGVIYSPKSMGSLEKNYLNKYTGLKWPKPEVNMYKDLNGDEPGKESLRVYVEHLKKICGDEK